MFMEERVHPIPFRTRQLSSPSSMILRTLTWESRTTPRLYFQRAVLSRTALCFARTHPHHGPPLPKPQARRKPLLLFLPLPLGFPPSFFFLQLYPPGSLLNRIICFFSAFFSFPASLIDLPKKGFRGPVFERKGGATESFS